MSHHETKILKSSDRGIWCIIETRSIPKKIDLYHRCTKYGMVRRLILTTQTLDSHRNPDWNLMSLKKTNVVWSSYRIDRFDYVCVKLTTRKHRYKCSFCSAYAPSKLATTLKLMSRV